MLFIHDPFIIKLSYDHPIADNMPIKLWLLHVGDEKRTVLVHIGGGRCWEFGGTLAIPVSVCENCSAIIYTYFVCKICMLNFHVTKILISNVCHIFAV